jgi:hypothetical protein
MMMMMTMVMMMMMTKMMKMKMKIMMTKTIFCPGVEDRLRHLPAATVPPGFLPKPSRRPRAASLLSFAAAHVANPAA